MQTPALFRSNLTKFYKFKYDMACDYFSRKEYTAAKTVFSELTQDELAPIIWKAYSYYMLAVFDFSMGNMYLEHARRTGALLQNEGIRVSFFQEIEARQAKLDEAMAKQQVGGTQQFLGLSHHQGSSQQR